MQAKLHSVSFISFPAFQTAIRITGQQSVKKMSMLRQKYDRCLYKGRRALVSTARLMCTLSLLPMQGSVPVISAFPTSISRSSNIIKFTACAIYIYIKAFKWKKIILYYSLRCVDSLLLWITRFWVIQWHQFGVAGGQLLHCVCSASEGRSDRCHICSSIAAPSHRI